jgi:hypothetical protein
MIAITLVDIRTVGSIGAVKCVRMRYLKKPLPAHSGELVRGEPTSRNPEKREILMVF